MTSEPIQPGSYLVPAMLDAEGTLLPRPVIVEVGPEGRIGSWRPLDGHEPHSTRVLAGAVFDVKAVAIQQRSARREIY